MTEPTTTTTTTTIPERTTDPKTPRGWGLPPAVDGGYHWSARAIYRDGTIDLLWDRQGFEGHLPLPGALLALQTWINEKALPFLRHVAAGEDAPYPSERREITIKGDGFALRANPQASYGYLYMSAAPDVTATDATPKVPKARKPAKPRAKRPARTVRAR